MSEVKKKLNPDVISHRFNKLRAAHQTELAEDYVEMIYELINEKGEARSVDLQNGLVLVIQQLMLQYKGFKKMD